MKKWIHILMILGLLAALSACKKKTEPVPVPEEDPSLKEKLKGAADHIKETAGETAQDLKGAAGNVKETAGETVREVGSAVKGFGSKLGDTFKKAKNDLEE
jgi:predicted small lipoprotein YifL